MTNTETTIQEMFDSFRSLPKQLRAAAGFGVVLFFFQLAFVASHLQAHLFVHILLSFYYVFVVYMIQQTHQQKMSQFLRAIDASCLVVKFNMDCTIHSANDLFCNTMGYEQGELRGMLHYDLVPPSVKNITAYQTFWDMLRQGDAWHGTYERRTKDGRSIWIVGSYTPLKDDSGRVFQVLKVARDVTDHIEDRRELQKKNTYLEHAAKILRHDMNSGINIYIPRGISSLERRLKRCPELVEELNLDMPLKLIKEGLTHTQRVYHGVKDFTNLVRPDALLEKKTCDLRHILSEHLSTTAYKSQVVLGVLPNAQVNPSLFCTAVDNLIRNGLKYNDSPTKMVWVSATEKVLWDSGGKEEYLLIVDNGRGMSAQEFEFYSRPYTRKPNQKENGTGLGLNICLAILHEHGFDVTCELNPSGGTIIRVRLQ